MADHPRSTADTVAIVLAAAIGLALNIITFAVCYAAVTPGGAVEAGRLGENATQILTGWGGGMIGVIGSFIGFTFGKKINGAAKSPEPEPPPEPPA